MTFTRLVPFTCASLVLVGCSQGVDLGGPRDDGGSSPADSSSPTVDAPSSTGDASSADQDGGPLQALNAAQSYANGNVACQKDTDCCVVFDGCMNEGLVVGVADESTVEGLVTEYDQAENALGSQARCTGCVPPATQVSCVQGKCQGFSLGLKAPDGGLIDESFMQDHCGTLPNAPSSTVMGSILGC